MQPSLLHPASSAAVWPPCRCLPAAYESSAQDARVALHTRQTAGAGGGGALSSPADVAGLQSRGKWADGPEDGGIARTHAARLLAELSAQPQLHSFLIKHGAAAAITGAAAVLVSLPSVLECRCAWHAARELQRPGRKPRGLGCTAAAGLADCPGGLAHAAQAGLCCPGGGEPGWEAVLQGHICGEPAQGALLQSLEAMPGGMLLAFTCGVALARGRGVAGPDSLRTAAGASQRHRHPGGRGGALHQRSPLWPVELQPGRRGHHQQLRRQHPAG